MRVEDLQSAENSRQMSGIDPVIGSAGSRPNIMSNHSMITHATWEAMSVPRTRNYREDPGSILDGPSKRPRTVLVFVERDYPVP